MKARRDLNVLAWLRQATTGKGLSFVVHRPDGMGPAAVASWPVTLRLEDFTGLLHAAGYGTPSAAIAAKAREAITREDT